MNEVSNPKPELEEVDLGSPALFGGSTSPFIEEGGGFTIESTDVSKPCCPRRWGWDNGGSPQYC